ncbi:MAG: TIGR02301 family protein [Pseudomonadota bacterium]
MNQKLSHRTLPIGAIFLSFALIMMALMPVRAQQDQTFIRTQDYFRDVIELSEVLGKAHAIRIVCNGRNDQYWRSYMLRLLDLEASYGGGLRSSMANAFNAGYSTTEARYRSCTQDAVDSEKVFAEEGQAYANKLAAANIPNLR